MFLLLFPISILWQDGYFGENCEYTPCTDNNCMNGANCFIKGASYTCDCFPGFSGEYCEVDPCVDSPCKYNTCKVDGSSTFCDCPEDLDGQYCEVDACVSKICGNGGICNFDPILRTASCECQNGFSGENCDIRMDTELK